MFTGMRVGSIMNRQSHGSYLASSFSTSTVLVPVPGKIFGLKSVEILVFPKTGYMLTSLGFTLLNWRIFCRFFQIDWLFS